MLKCSQCSHENDPTRIFCQNCGMRLERPEGTEATIAGNTPVMGRSAGKKKKFSFSFGHLPDLGGLGKTLGRVLRAVLITAVLAAVIAAFVQMGRKPDGIPVAQTPNEAQAAKVFRGIKAFSETVYPRALDLTQEQANNYLAVRVVSNTLAEGGSVPRVQFVRAFVVIGSGEMQFFVEQKFLGWSVFFSLTGVPEPGMDEVSRLPVTNLRVTGGSIGRLRLHARLVPILEKNLATVIASLPDAAAVLRKTNAVAFTPGVAKLSWSGSNAPGR